jgi:putative MATE family efflux protein
MQLINTAKILGKLEPMGVIPPGAYMLKTTIKMAWPSILESFLISSVIMINMMMVSGIGASAVAAVGLVSQPRLLAISFIFSLNIAVSAIVARKRGQNDREGANKVLVQAMMITIVLTAIISVVCVKYADAIMRFAGSESDTHEDSVIFFKIVMGGIIFTTVTMVNNAAQRGAGNTKISMRTNMIANIVTVICNFFLISGRFGAPALGVKGAAISTVIGTGVGCIMSIYSVAHKDEFVYFQGFRYFKMEKQTVRTITKIAAPTLVEQILLRIGFLTYAILVAKLGTITFATYQIGMQFLILSFAFGDGLSVAAVALVGRSLGQERQDLAKIYGNICQRLGVVFSSVLSILFIVLGKQLFTLYSAEPDILQYAVTTMMFMSYITFMQISQVIFAGGLRGAGDVVYVAYVSFVTVTIIRPLSGWILCYVFHLGIFGVWLAVSIDQTMRLVLTSLRFRSGKWMYHKI